MIGMVKKRINDLEIEKAELERQIDTRPTLRDQFAMAALPVIFQKYGAQQFDFSMQAMRAYLVADAMMEAREKGD